MSYMTDLYHNTLLLHHKRHHAYAVFSRPSYDRIAYDCAITNDFLYCIMNYISMFPFLSSTT